jgi:hypothetical protein
MSPEDAAPLAGVIKSRRWRQIEQGQHADDDVLAHMAAVVGVDPAQLEQAGRPESAEVLREVLRQKRAVAEPEPEPGLPDLSALSPEKRRDLIDALDYLRARIEQVEREERRRGA